MKSRLSAPILSMILALTIATLPGAKPAPAGRAGMAEGFRDVPSDARMRMYWRVFGPAWTEPEIDHQLAIMKSAGLGGVTVYFLYPVALDDPARGIVNQRFGSPEFLRTFGYAARKAKSLGLRFSVNGGTGWPYGGPTVTQADAAQRLREVRIPAGKDPAEALRLGAGEHLVAAFLSGPDAAGPFINVTEDARRGSLTAPLLHELRAYVGGPCGMLVKRPSFGGEGAAVSHYDAEPLTRWLTANVQPLLDAAPGLVESVGCDSLEVYRSNWTDALPREFARRRGYDLIPHLPGLFDDATPASRGLRFDLWRTLTELVEEQFTGTLGRWCGERGVGLEMEPYGTPPHPMTAAANISAPTGEHYEWKGFAVQKYVSSMAHINGKPIVGAEAWTWAGLPNRLGDTLSDIKLVSDMTFLGGANDLTGVDFPYSPESAGVPGWMPYYGPVMGAANPQWRFFPALVAYLNRCQWMLRRGEPVRKVAVYLPVEDAFAGGPADQMLLDFLVRDRLATGKLTSEFGLGNALKHESDLLHGLIESGYDYDGLDFWAVTRLGKARKGTLTIGPAIYEAVVLPNLELIETDALDRIAAFCRSGGTVVASERLPKGAPGYGRERESERVRRLIAEIFSTNPVPGVPHPCGRGRGIFVKTAADAAGALSPFVVPSVTITPRQDTVGFVHRRVGPVDIYFLANTASEPVRFNLELAGPARRIEAWDAMDGGIRLIRPSPPQPGAAPAIRGSTGAGRISPALEIYLPARGSIFIVAGAQTPQALLPEPRLAADSPFAHAIDARPPDKGQPDARKEDAGFTMGSSERRPERLSLNLLPWSVGFDGPDAPAPADLWGGPKTSRTFRSWTEMPGGRYFSGTGVYRTSFDWSGPVPAVCLLRFEEVREAAGIKVNGRPLGVIFTPPLAVDIAPALRSGANALEITVVNLPLNRFLGLPDEDLGPLRAKYGARFSAPEEKKVAGGPWPSGLIGRVWLEYTPVR